MGKLEKENKSMQVWRAEDRMKSQKMDREQSTKEL